jgi:hypothetical protein
MVRWASEQDQARLGNLMWSLLPFPWPRCVSPPGSETEATDQNQPYGHGFVL